jgi:hypothetical protein
MRMRTVIATHSIDPGILLRRIFALGFSWTSALSMMLLVAGALLTLQPEAIAGIRSGTGVIRWGHPTNHHRFLHNRMRSRVPFYDQYSALAPLYSPDSNFGPGSPETTSIPAAEARVLTCQRTQQVVTVPGENGVPQQVGVTRC